MKPNHSHGPLARTSTRQNPGTNRLGPRWGLIATLLLSLSWAAPGNIQAQTIIDDDFDGAEVTGWIGTGNGQAIEEQNISQSDSVITSEVIAQQGNTNRGIASEVSFEPAATGGFTITFVASETLATPGANGYFIGIVRDKDTFHRDADNKNFGLTFFGQDPRTVSAGGFGLNYGDNNSSSPSDFQLADSDEQDDVDRDSFLEGYTAELSVTPVGWSYTVTGLLDSFLEERVFSGEGTWEDADTSFDELFPAGDTWHAIGAIQVVAATTYEISFDRITLVGGAGGGDSPQFQIVSVERSGTADEPTSIITWASRSNGNYNVEVSLDLENWLEVQDGLGSDGETTAYEHRVWLDFNDLTTVSQLYYRIKNVK